MGRIIMSDEELNELYKKLEPIMFDCASKFCRYQSLKIKYPVGEITITVNCPIDLNNNNNED